ncbi:MULTISPECIES: helix-turn-helix transcriptional regulator [unclassified Rhizobium]|uniref:helix-turn-helix transcriptional regulator n=1 Tax=unclassified Rhizobium TaxID=2613769 RepID=UPI003804B08C
MAQTSSSSVYDFSTGDLPENDRLRFWVKDNHCDCRVWNPELVSFDVEAIGAELGPLILSGREWPGGVEAPGCEAPTTNRHIRADSHDFFRFTLVLDGRYLFRSTEPVSVKSAGDLFLLDGAQVNDCIVEGNNVISLAVPRDLLPSQTALLHGHTLTAGVAGLLTDHLISLFRNLPMLKEQEIPYVVQSTLQLLTAVVSSASDAMQETAGPMRELLLGRVLRYLDTHLLETDLTPDRICRDVGVSRAKLYQLFEGNGGVMRQIQRKRLHRAYQLLADPKRPRPHIAELAWRHGFSNEKYFYRLFKTEFGHTPGETLKNMLQPPSGVTPAFAQLREDGIDRRSG